MNKQLIQSKGTQYRTVTRVVDSKRVKLQEPVDKQHSLALIDGKVQVVKV